LLHVIGKDYKGDFNFRDVDEDDFDDDLLDEIQSKTSAVTMTVKADLKSHCTTFPASPTHSRPEIKNATLPWLKKVIRRHDIRENVQ
jgi:hypothetical protein